MAALAALLGVAFGSAAHAAGLSASMNPSSDGSYTVSWTAITGATKYQLLEDGTNVYEGTARSKSFTGKTAGSYTYTLTYCRYIPWPSPQTVCNLPSIFTALTVTVSDAPTTPPPAAPTLSVPATNTDGSYNVSWTRPSGATSYRLQEKTNNGNWGGAYSGENTSTTISGKSTAVYAYRVRACASATACSGWSATKSVRVTRTASTLTASVNTAPYGSYTLSWTASQLGSYLLKESVDGATAMTVYTGTGRSKAFSGQAPGRYAYTLQVCFSLLGSRTCVPSGSVTVTVPEPAGSISASPSPCTIAAGQSRCSTTVEWSTQNAATPCVFLQHSQGKFACTRSGSKAAPWISRAGATFLLKAGNTFDTDTLASVTVKGVGEPTVSASFTPPKINLRQSSTLNWSSTDASRCNGSPSIGSTATSGSKAFTPAVAGDFSVTVTCTGVGGSASDTATVAVNTPPDAVNDTASTDYETAVNVSVLANDSDAEGDTLRVLSASDPANGSTRVKNGTAVTYTPDDDYSGTDVFTYTISDGMASDIARVTVTVGEPPPGDVPRAPARPTVTATGASSLSVTWTAPADNGSAIDDYDVQYRKASATGWTNHPFSGTGTSTRIGGLDPNTAYAVQVRAHNSAGNGPWSQAGTAKTPDVVPETPGAPTVSPTDAFTLDVSWTAPASRGSAIDDYDVQYRKASATGWTNHAFAGTNPSTAIEGLDANTAYQVRVRAENLQGESPWSTAGDGMTPPVTNRAPVANDDRAMTLRGEAVAIAVLDNDTDADADDTLTVASTTAPASGSATVNTDGTVTYTPKGAFVGTDTFRYTVSDGTATASASVTVEVAQFLAVPNPSADGNYTVKWAALARASSYMLLEGGTAAYLGQDRSKAFSNKARGTYVYTLMGCTAGFQGVPNCRLDSSYGELRVQVGAPLPAAPAGLAAAPNPSADGSFRVSWSAASGATRYQLEERVSGSWSGVYDGTATGKDIDGRSITGSTPYHYRVRACAGSADSGCGDWSGELEAAVTGALWAEPNPSTDGRYTVRWTPSLIAASYKLDESVDGGATWPVSFALTGTGRAFTGKVDGTYTYRVRGCLQLRLPGGSREVCTPLIPSQTDATLDVVVARRLAPPTLTVTPEVAPDGRYGVAWRTTAGARSYVLQERTDDGSWAISYTGTGRAKSFTGRGAAVYGYQVKACTTSDNCSAWSPVATVRVPPAAPANLSATTPDANGNYTVSWDATTGADNYMLEQSTDGGSTWSLVTKQTSDALTSRTVRNSADGTFRYRLKACQGTANCGNWSVTIDVTVSTLPAVTPPGECLDGRYTVEWSATAGADRYQLEQRTANGRWLSVYSGKETTTTLRLTVGTSYSLRARACRTGAGCSAWGAVVSFVTPKCIGVPDGFAVDPMGPDDYTVEWNAVPNAARYELQRSVDGVNWTDVPDIEALSKAYENEPDGTYRFQVRACPASGDCGDWAGPLSVTVPIPTPVPQNLRISEPDAQGRHTVSWDPVSFGDGILYQLDQVHRNSLRRRIVGGTSRTFPAPTPGDYVYRVRACIGFSDCSDQSPSVPVTVPPRAPGAVTLPGTCVNGEHTVTWPAVTGANRYELSRQRADGQWSTDYAGAKPVTTLPLSAGTSYSFQARACLGKESCGAWSATATLTAPECPRLAVPSGLLIDPTDPDDYTVDWDDVGGAARYELQESADNGATWPVTHAPTASEQTFSGQAPGMYKYRVRACPATGDCGDWSQPVDLTVPILPPAPDNLAATVPNDGAYTVSWNAVSFGNNVTYVLEEQAPDGSRGDIEKQATDTSRAVENRAAGEYVYQVKACTGMDTCGPWSEELAVTVQAPAQPDGVPNTPPAIELATRPAADPDSDKVGATPGAFRVSESGAATYRLPILTASGIAGMAPRIALAYDSQGANGLVGQGFSIAGLSAITRCRQTPETDGSNDGIALDAGDRFCLDGQRLVAVSGTYGAADSEYRTEIDTYAKVVAKGGTTVNPAYFKVWRKDGTYATYGNTADSALDAPGSNPSKTLLWARNRLEDSAGNGIDYAYHEDTATGEHRITSITYAEGDAKVTFEYEARTDERTWYVAASKFRNVKRLKKVISKDNNAELRTYTLTYAYGAHNGVSQVTGVQECNGATCYPATTFNWSNPAIGLSPEETTTHQHGFLGGRPADIDGDGVNELVWMGVDDHNNQLRYFLRQFHYSGTALVDRDLRTKTEIIRDNSVRGIRLRSQARSSWTVIDYNNDGKHDVMYMRGDKWRLRLGMVEEVAPNVTKPSLSTEIDLGNAPSEDEYAVIADVNGDGLPDAIQHTGNVSWSVRLLAKDPTPDAADRPYHFGEAINLKGLGVVAETEVTSLGIDEAVFDFNADGVADFLVRENHLCEVNCGPPHAMTSSKYFALYASIDGDYRYRRAWSVKTTQTAGPKTGKFHFPDLNGDGYADIAYAQLGNAVVFALSDGKTFGRLRRIGQVRLDSDEADQIRFLDYNGDGQTDLVYPDGGYWRVLEFHDQGFAATPVSTGMRSHDADDDLDEWRTAFFDGNGDGKPDAIRGEIADRDGSNTAHFRLGKAAFKTANVIEIIADGFKAETTVTYKALTDASATDLYSRAGDASGLDWGSPVFDLIAPISVVQNVSTSAPAAGTRPGSVNGAATSSVSYEYAGARVQAGGRGWLGFRSVKSIDGQTGLETTTVYEQRFPHTGRPKSTAVRTSGGDLVSQTVNTWDDFNASGPNHQPYLKRSVEKTYATATSNAATGAFTVSGTVLSTVTTDFTMNGVTVNGNTVGYGDVDTITVTTTGNGRTYARVTDNDYFSPDLARWRLGRLSTVTVTHKRDDNTAANFVRKSSFTYYANTGLLKTETVEPGGASGQTLTTTYLRDSAGNVTEVKETGYGGPAVGGGTAPSSVDRKTTTVYDADKRYATVRRNHYGHAVETVASRNRFGEPTAIDDVDGHRTDIAYGAMGRETWRRDRVGGFTHQVYRLCSETGIGCPTGATFRVRTQTAGGGETIAYHDLLGREIRSATRMFDGRWSVVVTEYDALGRPVHVSAPFASSGAHTGTASHWTRRVYDHLGRLTRTTHPDGSTETVAYDGYTTTYTDGLAKTRKEKKNALGELIRIEDHNRGIVTFGYDEQGNLARSTQGGPGVSDVVTTMGYDRVSRKTSMSDPDRGAWGYAYNAFGELVEQTTATGDCTRIGYDRLGRQVRRIDYRRSAGASTAAECGDAGSFTETADSGWEYDHAASNGLGKLRREYAEVGAITPFERTNAYDTYGRPAATTTEIVRGTTTDTYAERTTYDQYGRIFQAFDGAQANSGLEYAYNAYGYLLSAAEAADGSVTTHAYYTVTGMDARGNVSGLNKAGLAVSRTFDTRTGLPDRVTAKTAARSTVHDLDFTFDVVGNLTAKRDRSRRATVPMGVATHKNLTETYCYDSLHRLTSVHGSATTCATGADRTLALTYDALGNIKTKRAYRAGPNGTRPVDANTDVGTYGYSAGSRAVTRAGSTAYTYDANGSMISGAGRSIAYAVFNKPSTITKSAAGEDDREILIHYGPNRDRYRRIDRVRRNGVIVSEQTTHYAGAVERIWRPDGTVDTKRYLDGELIVTSTERSGSVTETEQHLFKDHLGSTDLITDRTGAVEQAMSFDAFGLRRSADEFGSLTDVERTGFDTSATTLGFGNHEGLDAVGLVHMNGRVYDPLLGRFISADPYIPAPHLTQSYNPYSYAMNNPLSYVDPDGFFSKKLLRVLVTIVVHIVFDGVTEWVVNSILQSAIGFLPDLGRVSQAFDYGLPTVPSGLGGSAGAPSRLCVGANCLDAPAEVQAALGSTAGADYPGLPNGAITSAYLAAVTGSPNSEAANRPSRIGQALLIEHPLAAEIAVALIPFGCAATEEGCTTTDIVLDTLGFIPILKPATTAIKLLNRAAGIRTRTRAMICSFAAGTPVATAYGPRPIKDIQTGDWVLAKDEETGRVEPKRVSLAYSSLHEDAVLLSVRQLDGGEETVLTTSEHPFRVPGQGWVPAGMLSVGDELLVLSGETASLEAIRFPSEPLTAYNFEVEEYHTYAVGEDAIWVHNNCNYKLPPTTPKAFPDLIKVHQKSGRKRWKDGKGRLYEWDGRHGTLEMYNKRGRHMGEFDPKTGRQLKGPIAGRRIEP